MNNFELDFLPKINPNSDLTNENITFDEVIGDSPCPCCRYITIPNKGDALAYICPICMWEIDIFITSNSEPSDQNHGLSLNQARENYKLYGSSEKRLKEYCREPLENEYP